MSRHIIGVVGPIASGKGIVTDELVRKGFTSFSLSDILREAIRVEQLEPVRDTYLRLGAQYRAKYGEDVLARVVSCYIKASRNRNIIVDSIRNPAEIEFLRKQYDIKIIGVDATQENRYEYYLKRKRSIDAAVLSWDGFVQQDLEDRSIGIDTCLKMTDVPIINNNGTYTEAVREMHDRFRLLGLEGNRPFPERR